VHERVVAVEEAEGGEHDRRVRGRDRRGERARDRGPRRRRLVLRVAEVEPDGAGAEVAERGGILAPPGADHVVARAESRVGVPRREGRARRRPAGEHGHDDRARMRAEEIAAGEDDVVEMGRHREDGRRLAGVRPHLVASTKSVSRSRLSSATISGKRLSVVRYPQRRTSRKPARAQSSAANPHVNGVRTDPYQLICTASLPPTSAASASGTWKYAASSRR